MFQLFGGAKRAAKNVSRQKRVEDMSEEEQLEFIRNELSNLLQTTPPTIGVIGVSGTGKSSTLNSMFGTRFVVSGSIRGTTDVTSRDVELTAIRGAAAKQQIKLRVIDAPGLGEDIRKDADYLRMYNDALPTCDVIIWVTTARNRAVALDQQYLQQLEVFWPKIIFGINQIDLVDPINWDVKYNMPSEAQEANLKAIVADRSERFGAVLGKQPEIVTYSATNYYGLSDLSNLVTRKIDEDRQWLFEAIRESSADKWLDLAVGMTEEEKQKIRDGA